jgi:hypothetical protein
VVALEITLLDVTKHRPPPRNGGAHSLFLLRAIPKSRRARHTHPRPLPGPIRRGQLRKRHAFGRSFCLCRLRVRLTDVLRMFQKLVIIAAWASILALAFATLTHVGFVYSIYYKLAPLLMRPGMRLYVHFEQSTLVRSARHSPQQPMSGHHLTFRGLPFLRTSNYAASVPFRSKKTSQAIGAVLSHLPCQSTIFRAGEIEPARSVTPNLRSRPCSYPTSDRRRSRR